MASFGAVTVELTQHSGPVGFLRSSTACRSITAERYIAPASDLYSPRIPSPGPNSPAGVAWSPALISGRLHPDSDPYGATSPRSRAIRFREPYRQTPARVGPGRHEAAEGLGSVCTDVSDRTRSARTSGFGKHQGLASRDTNFAPAHRLFACDHTRWLPGPGQYGATERCRLPTHVKGARVTARSPILDKALQVRNEESGEWQSTPGPGSHNPEWCRQGKVTWGSPPRATTGCMQAALSARRRQAESVGPLDDDNGLPFGKVCVSRKHIARPTTVPGQHSTHHHAMSSMESATYVYVC